MFYYCVKKVLTGCRLKTGGENEVHWLFLLCSGEWDNDQLVDGQVDQQRSRRGVEDGTGQQLVRQVYGEQVRLTGTRQPATHNHERKGALEEEVMRGCRRAGTHFGTASTWSWVWLPEGRRRWQWLTGHCVGWSSSLLHILPQCRTSPSCRGTGVETHREHQRTATQNQIYTLQRSQMPDLQDWQFLHTCFLKNWARKKVWKGWIFSLLEQLPTH